MTVSAAQRHVTGLDVEAVSQWIGGLGIGARGGLRFTRIGQGQSNLTYLVRDEAGGSWVLRRPPLGELLASAHDVAREHRILSGLHDTAVPTPRMFGLSTNPTVSNVPLVLMEFVDGVVVENQAIAESLPTARRRQIGLSLARTLGQIHAVDLDRAGLADLASRKPYAARQLKRWYGQWERSKTREIPAIDDLHARLQRAMPDPGEITLVHGDFHLLNVITDRDHGDVVGVLDWELCTLGDPIADLGGLLAYWPQHDDPAPAVFQGPALPGFPDRAELAATYAEATGRDLGTLGFWHVLGLWKVAIICEGVLRRSIDEPRNAASQQRPTAQTVDDLVTRALAIAQEASL